IAIQTRIVGSIERYFTRARAWPSFNSGTGDSTICKSPWTRRPLGRDCSRNCRLFICFTPAGVSSVLQGFARRGHSLGSLWNALNLCAIASFDLPIDVVHQSDQRLLLLPVPDPNLRMHKVHAVLQGEFIGRPVCSASQNRKAHADGGEFAKPALYNA